MARGYPDYTGVPKKDEVALRQNILFPSGLAAFTDDFDMVQAHYTNITGGTGVITHSLITSFSGESCLRLYTGVAAGSWARPTYYIGDVTGSKLGIEFAFMCEHDDDFFFDVSVTRYDGTNRSIGGVRYYIDEQRWDYWNDVGGWSVLPGGGMNLYFASPYWHIMKLKVDCTTGRYSQLLVDRYVINMDTLPMQVTANGTAEHLEIYIRIENEAAAGKVMFVDNISITRED